MPGSARRVIFREETDLVPREDAQPQIVILRRDEILVEAADFVEQSGAQYDRRWSDETRAQRVDEDIACRLAMTQAGIHTSAVTQPPFVSLRNHAFRMGAHIFDLTGEFVRSPNIVRIQKRD